MAKEPPGGQLRDALAPPVQRCTHKSETLLRNTTKARYGRSEWNKKGPGGGSEGRFAGENWRASGRELASERARAVRTCSRRIPPSDWRQLGPSCQCKCLLNLHLGNVLLHEHPSKCISDRVGLVMNLVCRRRQVRLCTFQLVVPVILSE